MVVSVTTEKKATLTERLIKSLTYSGDKTKNEWDVWWDNELLGFGVRIYPTGTKSFVIFYRHNRRMRLKTIGKCGVITLVQARERARRDLTGLLDNVDPLGARDLMRESGTFAEFAEMFVERYTKPHTPASVRSVQSRLKKYLIPHFGKRPLISITHDDVARLHVEVGAVQQPTANRLVKLLSVMFREAKKWGVLPRSFENPAREIAFFPEYGRDRYVTPDELPRLIEVIEQEDIYIRSAFWLYLLTGLRKSELRTAKWEQIDFHNKQLVLPKTKNGKPHYLPLTNEAIAVLAGIPPLEGNPYIFAGQKEGQPLYDLKRPWERIRERSGLTDIRIHDLRHTIASWLVQGGNSLYLVGKILNHKDLRTTERYARFAQDNLRDALEATGKKITGIAGKTPAAEVVPLRKR